MIQRNGSILVMVLIIMTAIMAIAYSMLSVSNYCLLLAFERQKYEEQYQNAQK